jgi:hypothetical protein
MRFSRLIVKPLMKSPLAEIAFAAVSRSAADEEATFGVDGILA